MSLECPFKAAGRARYDIKFHQVRIGPSQPLYWHAVSKALSEYKQATVVLVKLEVFGYGSTVVVLM